MDTHQHHLISASIWRNIYIKRKELQKTFFTYTRGLLPILIIDCDFRKLTPTQGVEG